ncbi:hypothetical protein NDU88_003801 [Pleurodeles waltl]|uniref:Uncharacterized protein n=1 Tax=Pleurodeles waltl TaxID=8319 RepID=A0AAV7M6F8_PLEWA|nr:hypothetical protein NDU88_003801 [Pleurodeles waltl]
MPGLSLEESEALEADVMDEELRAALAQLHEGFRHAGRPDDHVIVECELSLGAWTAQRSPIFMFKRRPWCRRAIKRVPFH